MEQDAVPENVEDIVPVVGKCEGVDECVEAGDYKNRQE